MFDYIIIGAGLGGLGLAYRLKTKDNKIGIIENDKWGGIGIKRLLFLMLSNSLPMYTKSCG